MNITIVNCFDTYEHRVELLKRTLEAEGHRVSVVTSNFRHMKKCLRTECPPDFELVKARPYYKNLSIARLRSHAAFAKAALICVAEKDPELLWVLVPPNSLVKRAAIYKKKHPDKKLVLDFIDMWPESMPITRFKELPPFTAWRSLRDRYVNEADMVVTECSLFWETLEKSCPREKLQTLYLARDFQLYHFVNTPPKDKIALCYLGSINNIIDIPCIGEIIRKFDLPVELHIIGDGEKREELCETARNAGAEVIFHGIIYDPKKKQAIFDRCHAGLNIMKSSVYVGLTMKSMDYFAASLPVINNIQGDTWDFIEQHPIGINYSPETRLSSAKLQILQSRREQVRAFYDTYFSERVFAIRVREILKALFPGETT